MTFAGQAHFGNYDPSSFGWGDPRPNLVPLSFNGVNFGQCAHDAHPVFMALLTELVPHIQGGLHAGSCWSWATTDELPDGSHSFHWYGTAIDVNWNVNHMGNNIPDASGQYAMPRAIATSLARKYGCEWGGNWLGGFHDNMHFEIHLSPSVARTVPLPTAPDPLEEVMAMYASKAAFEAAMTKIAEAAVDRRLMSSGAFPHGVPAWLQTYLFGSPLYKDPTATHPAVDLRAMSADLDAIKAKLGA